MLNPVAQCFGARDLELFHGAIANFCGRPTFVHAATDCNTADVEEPEGMQENDKAGRLLYIEVLVLFLHRLLPRVKITSGNPCVGPILYRFYHHMFCPTKSMIYSKRPARHTCLPKTRHGKIREMALQKQQISTKKRVARVA